MKILITGLQLSGNKGGAALAECVMTLLRRVVHPVHFTLGLPRGYQFEEEKKWADIYGVVAVENIDPRCLLPPWSLTAERRKRRRLFIEALRKQSFVLDVSALSFVGRPYRSWISSIYDSMWGCIARKNGVPFLRWTQSYGPFNGWITRLLAKKELSRQPFVFCRGTVSQKHVMELLHYSDNIFAFPDAAIVLPFDREHGKIILKKEAGIDTTDRLITISPNSVIDNYDRKQFNGRLRYRELVSKIITFLQAERYYPIFVPHTFYGHIRPDQCDNHLSDLINQSLSLESIPVIPTKRYPGEIKSMLANACFHIGSRYHSLVGSLSAGVPSLALGWHHKYKDLLEYYGMDYATIDLFSYPSHKKVLDSLKSLLDKRKEINSKLLTVQERLEEMVLKNAHLLVEAYEQQTNQTLAKKATLP